MGFIPRESADLCILVCESSEVVGGLDLLEGVQQVRDLAGYLLVGRLQPGAHHWNVDGLLLITKTKLLNG